ncbi:MAG: hypothetical protein COA79_13965 [Planctomycetota bacterium]|nr:MAG: hypothetical protein COA79_13965 [Planctomycetota bacterium]
MKKGFLVISLFTSLFICAVSVLFSSPKFTATPVISKVGGKTKISFTVSEKTDVEVSILNAKGKIIKHLAAGVLGGKLPPPLPLRPGLSQEIIWDGLDDNGNKVVGELSASFKLGMDVKLDGFIAESRYWIGSNHGIGTDSKGNLFVYGSLVSEHRGSSRFLAIYDREGNYKKTIMPPPAHLKAEKLLPFNVKAHPKGGLLPNNHFGTWPELYPRSLGKIIARVTDKGIISLSDGMGLSRVQDDGTAPDPYFRRDLWEKGKAPNHYKVIGARSLAASPDGKYLYMTGISYHVTDKPIMNDETFPTGRIYRMDLSDPKGKMKKFVDVPVPKDISRFNKFNKKSRIGRYTKAHVGLDRSSCDARGNLFVADRMNNMIRVFNSDGKEIGSFPVVNPENVVCNHKDDSVFVTTSAFFGRASAKKKLLKFSSWKKDSKLIAELTLGDSGTSTNLAIDNSASPSILWFTGFIGKKRGVFRIEDQGDKLVVTKNLADLNKSEFGVKPRMAVHPETDVVICNNGGASIRGYDGVTGKLVPLPIQNGVDMSVGLDGNWYIQVGKKYSGYICRFDKDLKPLPVSSPPSDIQGKKGPANALGWVYGRLGAGYCTVGMAIDGKGRCYSMQMFKWANYCVAVYGPDGKPESHERMKDSPDFKKLKRFNSAIIGPIQATPGGIKVDWQGNIYIGLAVKPLKHVPALGYKGNGGYESGVGSVVKFDKDGGSILGIKTAEMPKGQSGLVAYAQKRRTGHRFLENAVNIYPELGCHSGSFGDGCMCRQPMFDLDGWGRLYIPNAITCSARIVDNSGNIIKEFGKYGNVDSRGEGEDSLIKTPSVPLGWPEAMGSSYKYVYISDVLNRRIVRMKKTYSAEQVVSISK